MYAKAFNIKKLIFPIISNTKIEIKKIICGITSPSPFKCIRFQINIWIKISHIIYMIIFHFN